MHILQSTVHACRNTVWISIHCRIIREKLLNRKRVDQKKRIDQDSMTQSGSEQKYTGADGVPSMRGIRNRLVLLLGEISSCWIANIERSHSDCLPLMIKRCSHALLYTKLILLLLSKRKIVFTFDRASRYALNFFSLRLKSLLSPSATIYLRRNNFPFLVIFLHFLFSLLSLLIHYYLFHISL